METASAAVKDAILVLVPQVRLQRQDADLGHKPCSKINPLSLSLTHFFLDTALCFACKYSLHIQVAT